MEMDLHSNAFRATSNKCCYFTDYPDDNWQTAFCGYAGLVNVIEDKNQRSKGYERESEICCALLAELLQPLIFGEALNYSQNTVHIYPHAIVRN